MFGQPGLGGPRRAGFGLGGALAGVAVFALVVGGLAWSALGLHSVRAQRPDYFGGTMVLEDAGHPLPVIELATAKVTVRLADAFQQVGASNYGSVQTVPSQGGTYLVNKNDGTFNLLEADDYVEDPSGLGVGLGRLKGSSSARGYGAGPNAYIVREAPHSTISLVSPETVAEAARLEASTATSKGAGKVASAVTPPGFASLGGSVSLAPGSVAVSGQDLWVLEGLGSSCDVLQLVPKPTLQRGLEVRTVFKTHLPCSRLALEATGDSVGLAEPGAVEVFAVGSGASGHAVRLEVPATASFRRFLPVQGAPRRLIFLGEGSSGWYVLSQTENLKAFEASRLSGLGSGADPVAPAYSFGRLYTLDQNQPISPKLWQIDPQDGKMELVQGAASYPLRSTTEKDSFVGAEVFAEGPRVVFNNPQSLDALVVFSDGSHAPVVVDKSTGVVVSATGPTDVAINPLQSQTKANQTQAKSTPSTTVPPSQTKPEPVVQPVSQQVTCAQTTQKPYAPQITNVTPSPQAATITWSYQLLDQTDCEPDSWSIAVKAISSSTQPSQPVQTENGQLEYEFTGLLPATTYQVIVTAYINSQSTPSAPVTFTTTPRGPDAPLSVTTTSNGNGSWVVSWTPCTPSANPNCVVPADAWTVTGSACGQTFVGQPPSVEVPGSQDSVTIDADSLGLLGDYLSFSVQGSLSSGLNGNPTSDNSCTEAWRPPVASAITLAAGGSSDGNTVTATLQVETTGNPVEAFGSQQTEFVYSVGGTTFGPTTQTTVHIPGLSLGVAYQPTVTVYPAGHPSADVTVTGSLPAQTLAWPSGLSMSVTPSVDPTNPDQGSLAVSFTDLPPGKMQAAGYYQCGSTRSPADQNVGGLISGSSLSVPFPDLTDLGGNCTLFLTVSDTDNPNPYGVTSPQLQTPFDIGSQPGYGATAALSQDCITAVCASEQAIVTLTDSQGNTAAAPIAGGYWSISSASTNGGGKGKGGGVDPCADTEQLTNSPDQAPSFPITFSFPAGCGPNQVINATLTLSYEYLGQTQTIDVGTPSGTPATTTTTTPSTTTTTTPSTTTTTTPSTTSTTTAACPTTTTKSSSGGSGSTTTNCVPKSTTTTTSVSLGEVGGIVVAGPAAWALGEAARRRQSRRSPRRLHPKGTP